MMHGLCHKAPELIFAMGQVEGAGKAIYYQEIQTAWEVWALGTVLAEAAGGAHPYGPVEEVKTPKDAAEHMLKTLGGPDPALAARAGWVATLRRWSLDKRTFVTVGTCSTSCNFYPTLHFW